MPSSKKRGRKASTHTFKQDGSVVTNETVIQEIKSMLSQEFVIYGYEYVSEGLKRLEYIINHKKVYRLMDERHLLLSPKVKTSGLREFVPFRRITATYAMEYLSMDIKYIYVQGERRNHYLLTIIDVYSKKTLYSILKPSIRKKDVIRMLLTLDQRQSIKGVTIRNDNGPQFIANKVRDFLRTAEVKQQFTHPGTPEENAYIEAYHSILDETVVQRYEFESFYEASSTIERFTDFYNSRRMHRSVDFLTPNEKWKVGIALRDILEPQNVGENEVSRSMDTPKNLITHPSRGLRLDKSFYPAYLCDRKSLKIDQELQNHSKKTVQLIGG